MTNNKSQIAENLKKVNEQIHAAAEICGRDPSKIKLIAVSKTKPSSQILEALQAGQLAFGENYAQELRDKAKEASPPSNSLPQGEGESNSNNIEWHFIGHLQKNKLKYVLPVANWIHTIDSVDLLNEIIKKLPVILSEAKDPPHAKARSFALAQDDKHINCLIEVNIAGEDSKTGIEPKNIFPLIEAFTQAPKHLSTQAPALRGLMCMPPFSDNPEDSRPYFKKLKNLLDEINARGIYPEKLTELSMGMSHDFQVAIEEGATMVRIGSAIFGSRGYNDQ